MIKLVSPAGWDWDRPVVVPLKLSSRGLIGHDRREFLKSASHTFLPLLDNLKIASDLQPVHTIALGSQEAWGANRNGDGFTEKEARACHPTFVSHAKRYRHHKNKPPDNPHAGLVKLSAYNDAMRRVELLELLFKTKEAAEREGGAMGRVADYELEKLGRGEDVPTSMSCRVPFDKCSACRHEARTRDEYCTAATCPGGGCRDNLARIVKIGSDAHHLHVTNPWPVFFDNSTVYRPADRTAYSVVADYLAKAAADGCFVGGDGARLAYALAVVAPPEVLDAQAGCDGGAGMRVKLAYCLAALEAAGPSPAFLPGLAPDVEPSWGGNVKEALDLYAALADVRVVLPLDQFARLEKRAEHVGDAAALLPGLYARACSDGTVETLAASSRYGLAERAPAAAALQRAARLKAAYALEPEVVAQRAARATLRGLTPAQVGVKTARDEGDAARLARDYASYQLAALHRLASHTSDVNLTALFAAQQNLGVGSVPRV